MLCKLCIHSQRLLDIFLLFSNRATGSFTVESETHKIIQVAHKEQKNEPENMK